MAEPTANVWVVFLFPKYYFYGIIICTTFSNFFKNFISRNKSGDQDNSNKLSVDDLSKAEMDYSAPIVQTGGNVIDNSVTTYNIYNETGNGDDNRSLKD